jgi:hypothetical protein
MGTRFRVTASIVHAETAVAWTAGLDRENVRDEYSAMGQTRFAPITLRTNATFIMLKSAKKSRA